ncbi:MAG: BrnT family toxin [Chitinispirillales bacterium]|jgi:uncharacterized DUF497 family protein|nr:BrnT family toxin [Chitinispirillales bacterium]
MSLSFEWDDGKDRLNIEKHGFSMALGAEVWKDGKKIELTDERFDYGEKRLITVGECDGDILSVCWTPRGGNVRLISVRCANRKERKKYYGNR